MLPVSLGGHRKSLVLTDGARLSITKAPDAGRVGGVRTASQPRPAERETSGGSTCLLNAHVWGGRLEEALGKDVPGILVAASPLGAQGRPEEPRSAGPYTLPTGTRSREGSEGRAMERRPGPAQFGFVLLGS